MRSPHSAPATHRTTDAPVPPVRPDRKPYSRPRLVAYGRIDEITETVGTRGRRDSRGRGGGRRRTGF